MQTKDLLNSAIVMAAEKLCDTDSEWERNSTIKGAHSYYEILQEKEKKSRQLALHSFFMSSEQQPWSSSAK